MTLKSYDRNDFIPIESYKVMLYNVQGRSKRAGPPAGVHGRVEGQGRLLAVRPVPLSGEPIFFCKSFFFLTFFIMLGGEGYVLRLETNIQVIL